MRFITAQVGVFITFLALLFLYPTSIYAISLQLSNANILSLSLNDEYQIDLKVIDAPNSSTYYLRGVFYQAGSSNYCGYTWNGSNWFKGPYTTNDGWKNFLKITISTSAAVTSLKTKLDPDDSGCKTSGRYNFKVQRFTQGGSDFFDLQNEQIVDVTFPSPTTKPSPTNKPAPTNIIAPSQVLSLSPTTSRNSNDENEKNILTVESVAQPTLILDSSEEAKNQTVLGISINPTAKVLLSKVKVPTQVLASSVIPVSVFLLGGLCCFVGAIAISIIKIRKNK